MKNRVLSLLTVLLIFTSASLAQEQTQQNSTTEKYRIITGVRINPLIIYYQGQKIETTRLHLELGALFHKRLYTSVGYTPFVNAVYNFNEYWFIGFDKKVPVSLVVAGEYMISDHKLFLQAGPNIKLSKIGNVFIFAFRSVDDPAWGVKFGTFIPLNVLIKKK